MNNNKIGKNALLNGLRTLFSVLFPLITMPYVSGVLQVDNIGKYNFSASVISYFTLLASLGISTYAVREGAKYRESTEKFSDFSSQIFTINVISMIVSYTLFALCAMILPKLRPYTLILCILSSSIFFTTIGCEWVLIIKEEFQFMAVLGMLFQVISLVLMFLIVKTQEDLPKYAMITVIASAGIGIANAVKARTFCRIKLSPPRTLKEHLRPIFVLFANTIATTIYVSSDTTILGVISGDFRVGIYSVATKIYSIVKQLLSAVIVVSIPGLSMLWNTGKKDEFRNTAENILNILFAVVTPAMVGLFMISKNVVIIISNESFISAYVPLRILCVALFFCMFSWFYTSCILIPCKRENSVLTFTMIAAVVNVLLNFVLIPRYAENAAAVTTVIAEGLSMILCLNASRSIVKIQLGGKNIQSVTIGCLLIACVCVFVNRIFTNNLLQLIGSLVLSAAAYGAVMIVFKNPVVMFVWNTIRKKGESK